MYTKSLNHDELEELFQKYADMPNINQFDFLASVQEDRIIHKGCKIRTYHIGRHSEASVDLGKVTLAMFSEKQHSKDGDNCYITTATCPVSLLPKLRTLYTPDGSSAMVSHICGSARIQEMRPHMRHDMIPQYESFLKELVASLGLPRKTAWEIAKITDFSSRRRIHRPMLWLTDVGDGSKEASELTQAGCAPVRNRAHIAGLVYMPPSFSREGVQFRIHVRRPSEGLLPEDYRAKEGRDLVPVIIRDHQLAERAYFQLRQGHPVYVEGTVEPTSFYKVVQPKFLGDVAVLLGVSYDAPEIQRIRDFFPTNRKDSIMFCTPTLNVWADRILTDEGEILETAAALADGISA